MVDLWDRFIEGQRLKLHDIKALEWKKSQLKSKKDRSAVQKEIDAAPKSIISLDELYSLTTADRDKAMEVYFDMRLLDFSIQTQTRFCTRRAADLGTVNELMDRNVMFEA